MIKDIFDLNHTIAKDLFLNCEYGYEVLKDINQLGLYVCGGVSNITGVDKYLSKLLQLPVYVDPDADSTVILGLGNLLNNQNFLLELCKNYK